MRLYYFLFFFFVAAFSHGQTAKYSNSFLRIGVGAEALGQAKAVSASVSGAEAGFWNPAALLQTATNFDVASMHSEYFAGLAKYDYIGVSYRIDTATVIALNLLRFGVDDIQNTIDLFDAVGNIDYSRITKFSVADYALYLSYARASKYPGLSLGGSLKVIRRMQGKFASAWGVGLDLAAHYRHNNWIFALVLRDVSTTVSVWTFNEDALQAEDPLIDVGNVVPEDDKELLLPTATLGVCRSFRFNEKWTAQLAADAELFFDGQRNLLLSSNTLSADIKLAMAVAYEKLAMVRAGVSDWHNEADFDGGKAFRLTPFIGLGLNYKGFSVDYALGNVGGAGGGRFSNYISLSYAWD